MKKKMKIKIFLVLSLVLSIILMLGSFNLPLHTENNNLNDKTFNIRTSDLDFTNATVISDGIQDIIWNDGISSYPEIALDHYGNIHVVWNDDTDGTWGSDYEIMYCNYSISSGWSIAKVISDGYMGEYWNDGFSIYPDIAIDSSGNIHVVWIDDTDGIWGSDYEIMYTSYSPSTGWANITVISDGYNDIYWNDGSSLQPSITTDNDDKIHVVWEDETIGIWGTDTEIMYTSYSTSTGWSNATIISDGHNNIYWNQEYSIDPDIAIDSSNKIHVVWEDNTDGIWGSDPEIMYTSYTSTSGWSLPTVVSDGYMGDYWNNEASEYASIAIDPSDSIHIAWQDETNGIWGDDLEIIYAYFSEGDGWSNATVISDGAGGIYWNDGESRSVSIAADINNAHIVWEDTTSGIWGVDTEIMYTSIKIALPPDPFDLTSNAGSPDDDGLFDLFWTESLRASNYSVYQHSSYITDINISLTLVDEGLTNTLLNLSEYESGAHYFIVEAFNDYGSTLSNNIFVEVQIPSDVIPFGNFYLFFSFATILGLAIYIKKKSNI